MVGPLMSQSTCGNYMSLLIATERLVKRLVAGPSFSLHQHSLLLPRLY